MELHTLVSSYGGDLENVDSVMKKMSNVEFHKES